MKLSSREKIMLSFLAIIGLVYLFCSYLYNPVQAKRAELVKENAQLKEEVQMSVASSKLDDNFTQEMTKLQTSYQELAMRVPGEALLPEVMVFLQKSAADSGVRLGTISIQPSVAAPVSSAAPAGGVASTPIREIKIQLALKGGYSDLRSFLLAVEKAPRLYRIDTAQMSVNRQAPTIPAPPPLPALAEGEEFASEAPAAVPVSPATISEITMNISLVTFYDNFSLPGFKDEQEKVQPGKGQDNPFGI